MSAHEGTKSGGYRRNVARGDVNLHVRSTRVGLTSATSAIATRDVLTKQLTPLAAATTTATGERRMELRSAAPLVRRLSVEEIDQRQREGRVADLSIDD